jgi:hypothetical protein
MIKEPEILNLEKTLEILDILRDYIDENNEIKPELFMNPSSVFIMLSIFSDEPVETTKKNSALDVFISFTQYTKINEILEANKIVKNLGLR